MNKKALNYLLLLIAIPLVIAAGVVLFRDRRYNLISMAVAFLSCLPFFFRFEKRAADTREMIIIAVMTAISAVGRFAFAAVPGFKPVTAIVVITAMSFGPEAGFLVGSLSALVSNIFFGQGPWTPFQMFAWGLIGFAAGIAAKKGWLRNPLLLSVCGVVSGAAFSLIMDLWTVLSMDGAFNPSRYLAAVGTSFPFMAVYAVSNVVFLLALAKPIGKKLERIKIKYRLTQ